VIAGPPDRTRHTLPAIRRIRRKPEFDVIQTRGRRLGNEHFGLTVYCSGSPTARLGLAVSLKVAGNGVERNRIRRIIRESFRLRQHDLPALDLVVIARSRARGAQNHELRTSLGELWMKLKQ
jgi:ribonuclease P protein component